MLSPRPTRRHEYDLRGPIARFEQMSGLHDRYSKGKRQIWFLHPMVSLLVPLKSHNAHQLSPGCKMWYQRVEENVATEALSEIKSPSASGEPQPRLEEKSSRKRKDQNLEVHDEPRQFRRVRLKHVTQQKDHVSEEEPVTFTDSFGNEFKSPFHLCSTWPVSLRLLIGTCKEAKSISISRVSTYKYKTPIETSDWKVNACQRVSMRSRIKKIKMSVHQFGKL